MTKKDYIKLADALRSSRPLVGGSVYKRTMLAEQWQRDVVAVAKALAVDNPRFDSDAFCKACGVYV